MAKYDEISSTEKLLELIRDDQQQGPPHGGGYAPPPPVTTRIKGLLRHPVTFKKSLAVGVDMGHEDLKLVKLNRLSEEKYEVLDYARVPYNPEYPRHSDQFHRFLRQALMSFCGDTGDIEIWSTISSARVETRLLRIPKVAPKQVSNTAFWSFQRLSPFNDKERIFDYEVLGEVEEGGENKLDVMAYVAPAREVEELRDLFAKAGFPLTGISIVPFAFQTLLRTGRVDAQFETVSSLYIGRDWSRIDIFSNGTLMLSRGIKAGVRTMIEALHKEIERSWLEASLAGPAAGDAAAVGRLKARLRKEIELAQKVFFGGAEKNDRQAGDEGLIAAKEERIFEMIQPALERLVRQVERTLRHFALTYESARVEKLYISSGGRPHTRITDYIASELGIPVQAIDPFKVNASFLTLVPPPESPAERSSFAPAMGMALSNNAITPNFLFTYRQKRKTAATQRINRGIFATFLVLIAVCAGVSIWQKRQIEELDYQRSLLLRQMNGIDVRVDQNLILKLVDQVRTKNASLKGLGQDYLGVAVLAEITKLTPPNVRLLSVQATLSAAPGAKAVKERGGERYLEIEGVISGDRLTLEAALAGFMMRLKNSPLFDQPTIQKKAVETVDNRPVMRFAARLQLK